MAADVEAGIMLLLENTKKSVKDALIHASRVSDTTKWTVLSPPANQVTGTYVASNSNMRGLVCARALRTCKSETLQRGGLYPFVIGEFKTNSLLHAAEWLSERHSAQAFVAQKCTAKEAMHFAHTNSGTWHLLQAAALLKQWPGACAEAYSHCVKISAHVNQCSNSKAQENALLLARACFVLTLPTLSARPTAHVEQKLVKRLMGENTDHSEIDELFPYLIDSKVFEMERELPSPVHNDNVWSCIDGLCALFRLPQTLMFDV